MSDILNTFKDHFEASTGIKPLNTREDEKHPYWKRLLFYKLNPEDILKISEYLLVNFSVSGKFTHLMPTIGSYEGYIALTIDVKYLEKRYPQHILGTL